MKILVVGDSYFREDAFRDGLSPLAERHELEFMQVRPNIDFQPGSGSESRLSEYEGSPDQVVAALSDHEVLVVHGAPVSADVLQASPCLRLVCCARGGPVNVDVEAAASLGVTVFTTPGKNAPAVADLTIALGVMLARSVKPAMAFLQQGGRLVSTFDGAQFFGSELSGLHLGLVGFGRVGAEVCARALGFGMKVSAYDPFVDAAAIASAGALATDLDSLARHAHIVSLHARQTAENRHLVDADLLATFRQGSYLINTARESLVDEGAVMQALRAGHLAGVAVDVFHPDGPIARALLDGEDRLVALPHVGGATYETMRRAASQIVDRIIEHAAAVP